jgi:hypothetical protein
MTRRKHIDTRVRWHLHIPGTVAAQVELLLLDPFLQQARFGAKSELVTTLLQNWLDSHAKPPPPDNTVLDKT